MNEELNKLKEARYLLKRQIVALEEQITVHYTSIKRDEINLKSLQYELEGINEKIYKAEQTNKDKE